MDLKKTAVIIVMLGTIAAFFSFDLYQYLALDALKAQQTRLIAYYIAQPITTAFAFFMIYVVLVALSIPVVLILSVAAGAIFGLVWGTVIVSFASSLGATLAFLVARFVFRDIVQAKFSVYLKTLDDGVKRDGSLYLFTLRLVPAVPFVALNLLMGLTTMKTFRFYLVSQAGMFPATIVFTNAGTQLVKLDSLSGILSPALLSSLALIAVIPFFGKWLASLAKTRKLYRDYPRPRFYDRNVVVIGAGSAGLVASHLAAVLKARVTLIEKQKMGGDCLNTGCIPSKALLRTARFLSHIERSKEFGVESATASFDFATVMQRIQDVITRIKPHDSTERYTKLGVECISGTARITSPFSVDIDGMSLTTRSIIIASGAHPFVPPIPGIEDMDYWTSDTIWDIRVQPKRLLILGGGPTGCELSQAFARLGCAVTQLEMESRLLLREDPEISTMLLDRFLAEGIDTRLGHRAVAFRKRDSKNFVRCVIKDEKSRDTEIEIEFDELLVAVGRTANTDDYGLAELGITLDADRTITTNEFMQTCYPNFYACGDVAGPYQFSHVAAHQAYYASVNALFAGMKRFKANYSVIPCATFTEPEIARVGLNEQDAAQQNIAYEVTYYGIDELDRAITDSEAHGFVKVLTAPGNDRILGAAIIGEHAGDLLMEFVIAMRHGIGMNKILGTIHIYPTLSEANKYAAANWKRNHVPIRILDWLESYHRWRRGTSSLEH